MEILSVKKLLKRWNMDFDELYNKIIDRDLPVYIETPDHFTDRYPEADTLSDHKFELPLDSMTQWDLKWTRLHPSLIKIEILRDENCPYIIKLEDIRKIEVRNHNEKKEDFWDGIFKNELPTNMGIEKASAIFEGSCSEILKIYKSLKKVTSTDPNASTKWKEQAILKFETERESFKYLQKHLLENDDIYLWYGSNPKRVFTGKLLKEVLTLYNLLDSIATRAYKKIAKICLDVNEHVQMKN